MSYILDALKKLEHDKVRKERAQHGVTSVAVDLLGERSGNGAERHPWQIPLLVLVVALLAAGCTWFLLRGHSGIIAPKSVPVQTAMPQQPAVATAPPVAQTPVQAASVQPAAVPQTSDLDPVAAARVRQDIQPVSVTGRAAKRTQANSVVVPRQNDAVVAVPPADIRISGIAWQDERSARRAVINGFLVHEGSMVAGYKVSDILQDRVRLSQSGRSFEVPLLAAAMTAGGK